MSSGPARKLATARDLEGLAEELGAEVVNGEVVYKAAPSFEHGDAQAALIGVLRFGGGGGRGAEGWWLASEVDVELSPHEVYRPDLVGWKRTRVPVRPSGSPVSIRPDWVCEILSPSTASRDLGTKRAGYHAGGVPHYWIVDTANATLTATRWHRDGYVVIATAGRDETVRMEPFEDVELRVGLLFGD